MKRFALLCIVIFLAHVSVIAQQAASATLTGTIVNANGGDVAGVTVTATHLATGIQRETTANEDGFYTLTNLPPGDYKVRFQMPGMGAIVEQTGVSLKVGQTVTLNVPVQDLIIDPVQVVIQEYRPLIDSNTSRIDGVIDSR